MTIVETYADPFQMTYSKQPYSAGLPKTSDIASDKIDTGYSIDIPSNYMPNTSAVTFNVNTYRNDFENLMAQALITAYWHNALASDCGHSFDPTTTTIYSRRTHLREKSKTI